VVRRVTAADLDAELLESSGSAAGPSPWTRSVRETAWGLHRRHPWVFSIVTACALVTAALVGSLAAWEWIAPSIAFFFAAVVLSAWIAGRASGVLASFLAGLAAEYYLMAPVDTIDASVRGTLRIVVLTGTALLIGELATSRRAAEARLRAVNSELEERVRSRTRHLDQANRSLVDEAARRTRAEAEAVAMQDRLRQMAGESELAEERERRRIASGLHDDVAQLLAAALLQMRGQNADAEGSVAPRTIAAVEDALRRVRSLMFELAPPVLYELGLRAGAAWLVEQFGRQAGVQASFLVDGPEGRGDESVETTLFHALSEVLRNVRRHAGATEVCVTLRTTDDRLELDVVDDGCGFDVSARGWERGDGTGLGLFHVAQRLRHVGGGVEIDSGPDRGTRVVLHAPRHRTAASA
jgi:signal transduction histidine kinase